MVARLVGFALLSTFVVVPTATAQSLPEGFEVTSAYGGYAFNGPVSIVFPPDGRHLVVERRGVIRVVTPGGTVLTTPFLDISDEVCGVRDLGLLGVALNPEYATDPWVYLLYTVDPDEDGVDEWHHHFSRLTRYRPSANPNLVDLSTREVLIGETWTTGIPSPHESHSVGSLEFGEDGTLLLAHGDGAHFEFVDPGGLDAPSFGPGRSDPTEDIGAFRARSLNSMAGKILRLDPTTGQGLPSNPFWDGDGSHARSRVWTYGVRNPYRFTLRPGTGDSDPTEGRPGTLYVGDVGWYSFEELNIVRSGGVNLGWPCEEGDLPSPDYPGVDEVFTGNENVLCDAPSNPESPNPGSAPDYWWHHGAGALSNPVGWEGYSSTAGSFYGGDTFPPSYWGAFFQADYVGEWLRVVEVDADDEIVGWSQFGEGLGGIVAVHVDPATGDLLCVDWFTRRVRRISYSAPVAVEAPATPPEVTGFAALRNPFRATTTFTFTLDRAAEVTLTVHDVAGRQVRTLADRSYARGEHFVVWNGSDHAGHRAAAGVYLIRLRQGSEDRVVRVVRGD